MLFYDSTKYSDNSSDISLHVWLVHVGELVLKLKLFGMFDVHINRSVSYWDIHVFDLLV